MINQNPNITIDNLIDEIAKQVKNYPKEPIYLLEYESYYCHFEVFMNDILVFKQFSNLLKKYKEVWNIYTNKRCHNI